MISSTWLMKSILIKDTTKKERDVADALDCGSDCSMCCACGGMEIDYQQYIDGKKEIAQLNAERFLKLERGFSLVISDSGLRNVCKDSFLYQKRVLP